MNNTKLFKANANRRAGQPCMTELDTELEEVIILSRTPKLLRTIDTSNFVLSEFGLRSLTMIKLSKEELKVLSKLKL